MAKAATYLKDIRAQVKHSHGGKVPEHLNLTIRNYASALEVRDQYRDTITKEGAVEWVPGSNGQPTHKQHPLCNLLYQQEAICQKYAQMLGMTAAKAAAKPEDTAGNNTSSKMDEYLEATME